MNSLGMRRNLLLLPYKLPKPYVRPFVNAQRTWTRNMSFPSRFPPPTPYRPPMQVSEGYKRFQHNRKVPFYKSRRVILFVGTGVVMFGGYYVTHLEKVPISGRARFMSVTPAQEEGEFLSKYNRFHCKLTQSKPSYGNTGLQGSDASVWTPHFTTISSYNKVCEKSCQAFDSSIWYGGYEMGILCG